MSNHQPHRANRLISTTVSDQTTQFNYNGDGARLRQIIQIGKAMPTYITYTQDLAAPLPVVLQAKTNTIATPTEYLYSLGTRPIAQYTSAWEYLLPDALGSVRQIADANSNVTLAKSYEPYGSVLNSTGSATSIFGYAGEQFDTTGLIYLRARYMQPTLGIFTSRNPFYASSPYRYASSNPINRIDPSGYIDWPTCVTQGDFGTCAATDGDYIYRIAREINAAGVSMSVPDIVADIIALNPQIPNPNYIVIGQPLTLRASWINAVVQSRNPQPPHPSSPPPALSPLPPWLPLFLKSNCEVSESLYGPVAAYAEGAAAVMTGYFGTHGIWLGREVVYNLVTLERFTFDVRGTVINWASLLGLYEADYYAMVTSDHNVNQDFRQSYSGHFENHCSTASSPFVSGGGLTECAFTSSPAVIGGMSTGTFVGMDLGAYIPFGPSYTDLNYTYLPNTRHRYTNKREMIADIWNGDGSPIQPGRLSTDVAMPIISLGRRGAIAQIDRIYP